MKQIYKNGNVEIWIIGDEYYVYGVNHSGDPRICPSEAMAYEVAACAG